MSKEKKAVTKQKKEIVIKPALPENVTHVATVSTMPEALISQAIEKNVSVETMEKLLAMRRELKAEQAKEAFDHAMAEFQGECPVIAKKKPGNNYKYAPLDDIVSQVRDLLKEHGFSYRIEAEMDGDNITATCIAIHKDGHSEKSSFTGKAEKVVSRSGSSVRSAIQDSAAALTYAKRYAFCNVFGIMTGDEDTDAQPNQQTNQAPKSSYKQPAPQQTLEAPTQAQYDKLVAEMKRTGAGRKTLERQIGKKLEELSASGVQQLTAQLEKMPDKGINWNDVDGKGDGNIKDAEIE